MWAVDSEQLSAPSGADVPSIVENISRSGAGEKAPLAYIAPLDTTRAFHIVSRTGRQENAVWVQVQHPFVTCSVILEQGVAAISELMCRYAHPAACTELSETLRCTIVCSTIRCGVLHARSAVCCHRVIDVHVAAGVACNAR